MSEKSTTPQKNGQCWDTPGQLSIIVQGPLFRSNVVDVANHCNHWRLLFHQCELILSVSATDFIIDNNAIKMRSEASFYADDYAVIVNALSALQLSCDKITFEQNGAIPLPAISSENHSPNNINLQLSAARAGLLIAGGTYCLRVRSDFIFLDRSFIAQYEKTAFLDRGDNAKLKQRVLISWLYTLNPYAYEKYPFHFSDWFHFGLTEDVVDLWKIDPMPYHDAIFFRHEAPRENENRFERRFYPRIAIEQHLTFQWAKRNFSNIFLDHRTDNTSRDQSVNILIDNFSVCDLIEAKAYFPKYGADFDHPEKKAQCIAPDQWLEMTSMRSHERPDFLRQYAAASAIKGRASFPRSFTATALVAMDSYRSGRTINNTKSNGVLFYGPYTDLPAGNYQLAVDLQVTGEQGHLNFRVTANQGQNILAESSHFTHDNGEICPIYFTVASPGLQNVELICEMSNIDNACVYGITFHLLDSN